MVIAATVVWAVGVMFFLVMGFVATVDEGFHEDEPFKQYYDSWGGVRFYTLWFFGGLVLVALWPLFLLSAWVIALIKGW